MHPFIYNACMINLDFLTLKAFLSENIDFLIGARLQKIRQPTRRDFILHIRNHSESKKLYININPEIYHISFMSTENEIKRRLEIPKQPPMFCMLLRKYIEGCRISDAKVVENERIFELHFETFDEFSQRRFLCFSVELMGKHSNVILYDKESMLVLGCAHNIGAEKNRYRELRGGIKYVYPPKKDKLALSNELKKQFANLAENEITQYLNTETYRPAISGDRYTLFAELLENAKTQASVSEMLDNYYSNIQELKILKNTKNKLANIVDTRYKKNKNSISKIETLLSKRENGEKYKKYGELLTSNLFLKTDYENQVQLFDYTDNSEITIPLDNTKTMNENAQRYFRLYTKFKNTKAKSLEILNNLKTEKEYLENILYSIEAAECIEDLYEIEAELGIENSNIKHKSENSIKKVQINGFDIYIGKNNKENDIIISKLSKDEDYWFHTRLCAGSHILLKIKDIEPDESTIYECAKLAREYSSAKLPSKVGIIYTKRKYIKKPPAAPLGYVIYKNEKEILI